MKDHWQAVAARWAQVGPPLRPSPDDVAVYQKLVEAWKPQRTLILGVTPEIEALSYPEENQVFALDHTLGMIEAVWPGPRSRVVKGNWRAMPFGAGSFDVGFCDGGLHLQPFPVGQREVARSLCQALKIGGRAVFRLFPMPEAALAPERVLTELWEGSIPNLNVLKLRLGWALQHSPEEGVSLADVYQTIADLGSDLNVLADCLHWKREHLLAIESYRGSANQYHFLGLDDAVRLFCDEAGGFELESIEPMDGCPIVVFRKRGDAR